jgi:predicted O-methyltransferase YrrM
MNGVMQNIFPRLLKRLNVPVIDLSKTGTDNAKWHQGLIVHLASILRPNVYVEVGIFRCGLFNQMLPYANTLIGVDANPDAGKYMVSSPKARFVGARSSEFAHQLKKAPVAIDMLFIDADHSQEAVEEDFRNFLPFVAPHGLILLHDTHPIDEAATDGARCGDGYKAIERLSKETEQFEMMTLPLHPGLTLCRKRTAQLSWLEQTRT